MKQQKVILTRDECGRWSYEDADFEKSCMTTAEVVAMFIARLAATIQVMDNEDKVVGIEIMLKRH